MSQLTRRSDCYREFARVVDMCAGTGVDPVQCVRRLGAEISAPPSFQNPPGEYEFAIALIEGKPLFSGDTLYDKDGIAWKVDPGKGWTVEGLSWAPPLRTIVINNQKINTSAAVGMLKSDSRDRNNAKVYGFNIYAWRSEEERDIAMKVFADMMQPAPKHVEEVC